MYIVLAVSMSRLCRSTSADLIVPFIPALVKDRSQAMGGLPLVSTSDLGQWGLYGGVRGLICLAGYIEQRRAYGSGGQAECQGKKARGFIITTD